MKMKKVLALALALVLIVGATVAGTVAWLMDTTGNVTNTFTVGNIDIDLKEHDLKADGTLDNTKEVTEEDTYKIIPGTSQPKDPFVRVEANSDACWVFIKVEEKNSAATYITYSIDNSVWTPLVDDNNDGIADNGVYYKDMPAVTVDTKLNILSGATVSYSENLTKTQINNLYTIVKDADGNVTSMTMLAKEELHKLQFTAYAIQKTNGNGTTFTASEAWTALNNP